MLRAGDCNGCVCVMRSDEQMLPIVAVKITTSGKHVIETTIKKNTIKIHTSEVGGVLNPVFG